MRSLLIVGLALWQILASKSALAQTWPQEPVRIVVSFGAGGGADIVARIIADALQDRLGKPVVVENKPGAGGILGNEIVANAARDGYTLGIMTAGQILPRPRARRCHTTPMHEPRCLIWPMLA